MLSLPWKTYCMFCAYLKRQASFTKLSITFLFTSVLKSSFFLFIIIFGLNDNNYIYNVFIFLLLINIFCIVSLINNYSSNINIFNFSFNFLKSVNLNLILSYLLQSFYGRFDLYFITSQALLNKNDYIAALSYILPLSTPIEYVSTYIFRNFNRISILRKSNLIIYIFFSIILLSHIIINTFIIYIKSIIISVICILFLDL